MNYLRRVEEANICLSSCEIIPDVTDKYRLPEYKYCEEYEFSKVIWTAMEKADKARTQLEDFYKFIEGSFAEEESIVGPKPADKARFVKNVAGIFEKYIEQLQQL